MRDISQRQVLPSFFQLNFFILLYILRVLISRFATNTVEVAIIRRTLKAVSVLVPIFGIQVCFTMFRTPGESFIATFLMNVCTSLTEDLQVREATAGNVMLEVRRESVIYRSLYS